MRTLKQSAKRLLQFFGFDVVRLGEREDHPFDLLGLAIEHRRSYDDDFFFVQIGANDGVRSDKLYPQVRRLRLEGLLVEPLPDLFSELKNNYADQPQLIFENCAIASKDGHRKMYRFRRDAPVVDWVHGMASFDKRHLVKFHDTQHLGHYVEEVEVVTMTFESLAQKYGIECIGLLQIDTEGYDFEIIKMVFKAGLYPEMMNFEHQHLSTQDYMDCRKQLVENGYGYISYGRDVLAIHAESPLFPREKISVLRNKFDRKAVT